MPGQVVAFWILVVSGLIGLFDATYYHMYRFRLYRTQGAYWEQLCHVFRCFLYGTFYLLCCLKASGSHWWVYGAVIVLELINTFTDTILETITRKPFGGLPGAEYVIHATVMLLLGWQMVFILWGAWPYRTEPDGFVWFNPVGGLPMWSWLPYFFVIASFMLGVVEGVGFVRMTVARLRGTASRVAPPAMQPAE